MPQSSFLKCRVPILEMWVKERLQRGCCSSYWKIGVQLNVQCSVHTESFLQLSPTYSNGVTVSALEAGLPANKRWDNRWSELRFLAIMTVFNMLIVLTHGDLALRFVDRRDRTFILDCLKSYRSCRWSLSLHLTVFLLRCWCSSCIYGNLKMWLSVVSWWANTGSLFFSLYQWSCSFYNTFPGDQIGLRCVEGNVTKKIMRRRLHANLYNVNILCDKS